MTTSGRGHRSFRRPDGWLLFVMGAGIPILLMLVIWGLMGPAPLAPAPASPGLPAARADGVATTANPLFPVYTADPTGRILYVWEPVRRRVEIHDLDRGVVETVTLSPTRSAATVGAPDGPAVDDAAGRKSK